MEMIIFNLLELYNVKFSIISLIILIECCKVYTLKTTLKPTGS
ncbi:mt:ND4L [Drosophila busckii]|uniref:Mt:ND4L n=1 Tax=Drosophila busckii TaxID=30019 RepID=A0A0M4ECY0_DROBS|nr:mt:ND4L [Drosophila busckii]